jgi:hypothetical protein
MILKRVNFIFIHIILRNSDVRIFNTLLQIKIIHIAPIYITTYIML